MALVEKVSVSLGAEEVEWARHKAEQSDTSFSAVVSEALRKQRQHEARLELLAELGDKDITAKDLEAVYAEWRS
jgi:mannitol/fructose-specific phosphotransferase system IIA component (Ntr-type)